MIMDLDNKKASLLLMIEWLLVMGATEEGKPLFKNTIEEINSGRLDDKIEALDINVDIDKEMRHVINLLWTIM